jgi:hypothetical protein
MSIAAMMTTPLMICCVQCYYVRQPEDVRKHGQDCGTQDCGTQDCADEESPPNRFVAPR